MLINSDRSCLLVVDVQQKLLSAVHQAEQLIDNCRWMIEVAQLMNVPVFASEQYPAGLGHTAEDLRKLIADERIMGKLFFSCADAPECQAIFDQQMADQVVIVGMEAHVCVLQTALRLAEQGKQVFVVADAISSRSTQDIELAVARMRSAGVHIVSREMVGFEWLRSSGAEQFKAFSKGFLQK
jgi:nicotinamidase-related amidase